VVAPFFARGDTATPVKASLSAAAVNIFFKILLMGSLAQVGLALATAIGAWINLLLVLWFAARAGYFRLDEKLKVSIGKLLLAGAALGIFFFVAQNPLSRWLAKWPAFQDEATLAALALAACLIYGGLVLLLLGRPWLKSLADRSPIPSAKPPSA